MRFISLLLIIPGLIAAYFIFLRPLLSAMPQLKQFYAEADGFWAKAWAICGKEIGMVWSYFLVLVGILMQWLEPIAAMFGDPDIKSQVTNALSADPQMLGYVMMGISAITIAARLHSISKG